MTANRATASARRDDQLSDGDDHQQRDDSASRLVRDGKARAQQSSDQAADRHDSPIRHQLRDAIPDGIPDPATLARLGAKWHPEFVGPPLRMESAARTWSCRDPNDEAI
ncbi:hypothetical protein [Caballeronia arvi]|uniref:hypothetical protein n=1 Tax=Caballeronia arvi TaxID=1777135 RepID=UPI000A4D193E|nr:hypothetical protein [Caballeronia arvi]